MRNTKPGSAAAGRSPPCAWPPSAESYAIPHEVSGLRGRRGILWIRIGAQWKIGAVRAPLVKYRRHTDSMSSDVYRFESDNSRVLMKVFSSSVCMRVHHLRRRAFGRLYMILAGSYFHEGNPASAARYAWKALLYRPWEIAYLFGFPLRALRRFAGSFGYGRLF